MIHKIIHEEIENGKFVGGDISAKEFTSVDSALEYYEKNLKTPLSQRIKQQRNKSFQLFNQLIAGVEKEEAFKSDDANQILSPERTAEFNNLYSNPDEQQVLELGWPNIWKVHLYEHPNFNGGRYTLNCKWTSFPYEANLANHNFNDKASSIDTGKLVLVTICAEHTWFRGNWFWFFKDDKNLTNNGCNDCISSIAATSLDVMSLVSLLKSLAL